MYMGGVCIYIIYIFKWKISPSTKLFNLIIHTFKNEWKIYRIQETYPISSGIHLYIHIKKSIPYLLTYAYIYISIKASPISSYMLITYREDWWKMPQKKKLRRLSVNYYSSIDQSEHSERILEVADPSQNAEISVILLSVSLILRL